VKTGQSTISRSQRDGLGFGKRGRSALSQTPGEREQAAPQFASREGSLTAFFRLTSCPVTKVPCPSTSK
jgi:hypothetical protein